ncbi:hypothetical protein Nepgr_003190 [Nepenthes gracilis]|uniref:BHLH domain-containing protein n=1 Tax=Nepenthes gracilis TaxID=150966 RepID=A0AAD3XDH8_NEPGR|nr:hypothetical protein Nepgr_003190 [Nepenthes gracilis]
MTSPTKQFTKQVHICSRMNQVTCDTDSTFMQYSNIHMRSASKILKEVCTHIKKLQKEVDEQSERLSELLSSVDINTVDAATLRSLLQL